MIGKILSFCGDREVFAKREYKFTSKIKIEYRANQSAISEGKKIPLATERQSM